jgi:hypothetical protein
VLEIGSHGLSALKSKSHVQQIYQITPILIGFKDKICDQQIPRLFPRLICNFFHLSSQTKQFLNSIPQILALPQIPVSNPLAKHTIIVL